MNFNMYTEMILDLYKNPRNKGELASRTHEGKKHNPLCGDEITLHVKVEGNVIKDISFLGHGCAISQAAVSLLTDEIKGKSVEEIKNMTSDDVKELLGIPISPGREKCALLGYTVLKGVLE